MACLIFQSMLEISILKSISGMIEIRTSTPAYQALYINKCIHILFENIIKNNL
jgi:hypothetical protein